MIVIAIGIVLSMAAGMGVHELRIVGPRELPWSFGTVEPDSGLKAGNLTISVGAPVVGDNKAQVSVNAPKWLGLASESVSGEFGRGKGVWRLPSSTVSVRSWHIPFKRTDDGDGSVEIVSKLLLGDGSTYESVQIIPIRSRDSRIEYDSGYYKSRVVNDNGRRFGVIQEWLVPLDSTDVIRSADEKVTRRTKGAIAPLAMECAGCSASGETQLRFAVGINGAGRVTSVAFVGIEGENTESVMGTRAAAEGRIRALQYMPAQADGKPVTDVVMIAVPVRGK